MRKRVIRFFIKTHSLSLRRLTYLIKLFNNFAEEPAKQFFKSFSRNCKENDTDLDLQSEIIIFESLLTTFEAAGAVINDGSSLKPSEANLSKLSLCKSVDCSTVQLFENKN